MNLYFIDSEEKKHLVSKEASPDNAFNLLSDYVKAKYPNYKIYYIRCSGPDENGMYWYDFGSHIEFFEMYAEVKDEALNKDKNH